MNAPMQQWLLGQRHGNHRLFSDHYLDVTLPGRKQRKELVEQAQPVVEEIAGVFALCAPSENEEQTECDLVRPLLEILRHHFEAQIPLYGAVGTKQRDYVFYRMPRF